MKMLALYSIKGGVGKTASAVNLAAQAAMDNYRVLLWDLDPQAATTFYLRAKPKVKGGMDKLVKGKASLEKVIHETEVEGLDLLPASFDARELDQMLDARKPSHLRKVLKPVRNDYDLIILDCPPSISVLSEQVFSSVDALLVPLIPTTLSLRTLHQLRSHLDEQDYPCPIWPFFTLADRRKSMHLETMAKLSAESPLLLSTAIPSSSAVEKMGLEQAPIFQFAPRSPAAEAYTTLWREIAQRLS
ncbi:MAG: cobyrinic acid a,c-diamide synthase [Alteromonadaceae bacterium]|nr:cobyrinic acid a,c-diamide synthase [Alteromonadaceae bacterium]|tara:strand:+ start:285 stop:1019 length:735 start_codon:yes stop_codon:yes gene_type:complete